MQKQLIIGLIAALDFTGCAHTEKPREAVITAMELKSTAPVTQTQSVPAPTIDPTSEVDAVLRASTVFFEFDRDQLGQSGLEALQRVATVLRKHPTVGVKIEGNCDERGTEEYNLLLGQRRAAVARTYLLNLGVNPSQLDAISFGAMRPVDPGHSEQAWSQNRRDELHAAR